MKLKKLNISILILTLFLIPAIILTILINKSNLQKENKTKLDSLEQSVNIDENVNIALFGLDRRNENEKSRSDSIMIASINIKEKKVKLISLLRDTLVDIEGHGKDKLNHAYAYGGAPLAIQTINSNFDLNLDKFVAVDFFSLAKVIDIVGGVEIELKDYEAKQINNNLVEINNIEGLAKDSDNIEGEGIKTLNGRQAVAYSRIRKEGNGDYERTQRQRNILKSLAYKYQNQSSKKQFEINMEIMGQVSTNIPINYIKDLSSKITDKDSFEINQYMIPYEGSFETKTVDGMWVIDADKEANIKEIHKHIK